MLYSAKQHNRKTDTTWLEKGSWLLNTTPGFLATLSGVRWVGQFWCWYCDGVTDLPGQMTKSSGLDLAEDGIRSFIHIDRLREVEICAETVGSCGRNDSDNLVSSVIWGAMWADNWPKEMVYIAKSRSPSTEPLCNPVGRGCDKDLCPRHDTMKDRPLRQSSNWESALPEKAP